MPATGFGQIYNDGIKYIKINRYDSGGLDRSDYLSQLQSITLTYPDRSAIEYPITTIQEQANFYLYGITPGYNTSSAGDVDNYSFLTSTTTISSPYNTSYYTASNFTVNSGNNLGYFTASSGLYGLNNTPNTAIKFTFTASFVPVGVSKTYQFVLINNNDPETPIIASTSFTVPAGPGADAIRSGSLIFSSSTTTGIPFIEGTYNLGFGLYKSAGSGDPTINYFNITASNITSTFNGSSSLAIFTPDAINFDYNDYNPLLDNAETAQYSDVWMDVDYSQNPLTPINFGLIISGTADRAYVQDSNYSSQAWSNIRYNGSRTTSYIVNQ